MKTLRPTKNWKEILLTRDRWPKHFRVQGVSKLPHKSTWWNTGEDESFRWCWCLYRMSGGREYFLGIWPGDSAVIDKQPPQDGYVRLSIRETLEFCIAQCFGRQMLEDLRHAKVLTHPGLLLTEKENRSPSP